jgi:hypothetical protein
LHSHRELEPGFYLLVTVQPGFAILSVEPGFNLSVTVQLGFASVTFEQVLIY